MRQEIKVSCPSGEDLYFFRCPDRDTGSTYSYSGKLHPFPRGFASVRAILSMIEETFDWEFLTSCQFFLDEDLFFVDVPKEAGDATS